ncbi:hypothetical protein HPB49_011156 [Dermacentor silvarum]|uniref:Uncharacterized protein n=1 Tax=Dermacentor silvarum TaxID=543639 RepID=A0ACB8CR30_DERSI|nr:hypothetical protein HPB49_011156 [Dermacentor silvarum]
MKRNISVIQNTEDIQEAPQCNGRMNIYAVLGKEDNVVGNFSAAIRCLIIEKVLEPEAEITAWFLELIAKWYKLMSSRHPSVALSCRDMAKYHAALDTLRLALETIQGMQMGSASRWKPSQAGLMIATTVVLRLQDALLKTDDYKFFLTGRLLQDCLDNLFYVVRQGNPFQTRTT